jgi:hypothetical protein
MKTKMKYTFLIAQLEKKCLAPKIKIMYHFLSQLARRLRNVFCVYFGLVFGENEVHTFIHVECFVKTTVKVKLFMNKVILKY